MKRKTEKMMKGGLKGGMQVMKMKDGTIQGRRRKESEMAEGSFTLL